MVERSAGVKPMEYSSIVVLELSPSSRSSTVIQSLPGGNYSNFTCRFLSDYSMDMDTSFDVLRCANGLTLLLDVQYHLGCANVWKTFSRGSSPFIYSTHRRQM
jgi:hypothetical protein